MAMGNFRERLPAGSICAKCPYFEAYLPNDSGTKSIHVNCNSGFDKGLTIVALDKESDGSKGEVVQGECFNTLGYRGNGKFVGRKLRYIVY